MDHVLRRTQDLDNGEQGNLVKREDMTLLVRCFKPGAGHQVQCIVHTLQRTNFTGRGLGEEIVES